MPTNRTRTIGPFYTNGERNKGGYVDYPPAELAYSKYCDDWVGNYKGDNPLLIETIDANGSFSGDNHMSGFAKRSCLNYASNRRLPSHLPLPAQNYSAIAAEAAAESNPARAHVSVPLFIYEMKDIPLLVKHRGDNILKTASSLNLSWQFGIKPFVNDLGKMIGFHDAFEKRRKEIEDLTDGGLKRRITLGTQTVEDTESFPMETYLFTSNSQARISTTRKTWATTKWRPSVSFSDVKKGSPERMDYVRNSMLGLTAAQIPENIWNAVPWSWLVDWFSSAGDFIAAQNNSIAHLAGPVVICVNTTTTRSDDLTAPKWVGGDQTWSATKNSKFRVIRPPGLQSYVPFLNKRQLSILGSLAALKL